jgi:thymidylate synthase ThyX
MTIEAKIVAHSSHPGCPDLITVQARYPRFIHSELMTHRAFSRSASSSRAVPIERMIQDVLDDPAIPVEWGSNKAGMQSGAEIEDVEEAEAAWLEARDNAVVYADHLLNLGLHKQIVNRVLEPFAHISVVITATDWQNFFDLRCHPAADPTMRALAEEIRTVIDASTPTPLGIDDWHKPYGGTLRQSAARCARVSYLNHDGSNPDPEKDDDLADRLYEEGHMSPFEHQAAPMPGERHANLNGWTSYRSMIGE